MKLVRAAVAAGGLVAALLAVALPPPLATPAPRWVWRFFIVWCVATPYWHYAEYRLMRDKVADHADLRYGQTLSRAVWLGFALVFAVWLHAVQAGPVRCPAAG